MMKNERIKTEDLVCVYILLTLSNKIMSTCCLLLLSPLSRTIVCDEENERRRVPLFPFFSFLFFFFYVICEFYRIFRKEKNHGSSSLFAFVMHRSLRKFSCSLFPTNHLLSTLQTSYKPPSSCLPSHRQSPSLSPT